MVLTVRSRQHWDVKCPPRKKHMVAGKLVPTVRGIMPNIHRKKRVVLEVHGHEEEEQEDKNESTTPTQPLAHLPTSTSDLLQGDIVVLRILKPRKHWGLSRDPDTDSDEEDTDGDGGEDDELDAMETQGWIEYRKFDLDDISDDATTKKIQKTTMELQVGRGNNTEVREFRFSNQESLESFDKVMEGLRQLNKDVANQRAQDFQTSLAAKAGKVDNITSAGKKRSGSDRTILDKLSSSLVDEDINLLVELVGASDLPVADLKSSDPYVVVWLGKQEVHRTKPISKTIDPIWTVDNGSLFILSTRARDFFQSTSGLSFLIKDYDVVGSNEVLGTVHLDHETLLSARGERVEYPLVDLLKGFDGKKEVYAPKLNIRVRPATRADFRFIKNLHKVASKKQRGVYADEAFVSPATHPVNRLRRKTKTGPNATSLHRVKPGPDPSRPEADTKWLPKETIEADHFHPSTNWIETGSGSLGRVYLEVLHCDGLPNMDKGVPGDKTDAFCSIIYEDAIVNTDVINDELSPRWLPWSQRAFLFHMQHSSSQILIGVFDWDGMGQNDPIGRVTVDITNFYEKTDYILTYTLFESVLDEERKPRGTITLRLRLETTSFLDVILTAMKGPPPANFVNVTKKEDFRSARFVTCGEENLANLDMNALKSYGNELQGYQDVVYYIQQAVMTVLLWRGHYQLNLFGCKFKLALHSLAAFIMGVLLVEDYNLFPAFFLFWIGWFFLATNEERQRNPSPWCKSATFGQMWKALLFGRRTTQDEVVVDDELRPLIAAYEEAKIARQDQKSKNDEDTKKQGSMLDEYFAEEDKEAAEEAADAEQLETSTGGMQLHPLKPILLPIQQILGQICVGLRVVKSMVTWEESVLAFLITNACFLGGLVLLFIPWGWVVRWVLRVTVWLFLGPWMKLVDIFIVRKLEADGENFVKQVEAGMKERSLLLELHKRAILTKKEDALKYRSMKKYMFGKFIVRVPQFKEYRYPDIPLSDSSKATPHDDTTYSSVKITQRKHGQRLTGHMIPSWGDEGESAILSVRDKSKIIENAMSSDSSAARGAVGNVMSKANPMRLFRRGK